MLRGAMSLRTGRSFLSGPNIAVRLSRPCTSFSHHRLFRISGSALCGLSQRKHLSILSFSLTTLSRASIPSSSSSSSSRAARTHASLARSGTQKTSWDEAADSYFSEEKDHETPTPKPPGVKKWKSPANRERQDFGRNSDAYEEGDGGSRVTQTRVSESGDRQRRDVRRNSEYGGERDQTEQWQRFGRNSDAYESDGGGRTTQTRNSESGDSQRRDVGRNSGYGGERDRTEQWQRPASRGGYRSRDSGASGGRSGSDSSWSKGYNRGQEERVGFGDDRRGGYRSRDSGASGGRSGSDSSWSKGYNRGQEERAGFGDDRRWQAAREYSPPLLMEGQALYGVAPIISALQVSRRTFYCLYMQENLLLNIGIGRRKDKAAVTAIEKMAKGMGVAVKEASKHDLNMLVDNRPHQGLVLDASPLELIPVDSLDAPAYQDSSKAPPVWVALDEVTDPQNFGAILRSAYFLGAEGVVVCAKNSAPLSGVVSKASAGAMEVMEVLFCKNMMRFLDKCKENGWRVVGASAEPASVPVRALPHGIATVLVLGSEGKGLRTNVKRSCDQLVSIAGTSSVNQRPNYGFVAQDFEEPELDLEEDEDGGRRGAEAGLISGPSAVDSLNVSVAAGILLYELLGSPAEKDVRTFPSE